MEYSLDYNYTVRFIAPIFCIDAALLCKLKAIRYESTSLSRIVADKLHRVRLQLHVAIYRPDSFVLMLRYCAKLKAMRYESTSFN